MNTQTKSTVVHEGGGRLPAHASLKVDYSQAFEFKFNGKMYPAYKGDTIVTALWAAGVKVLGRSFKYHRPRAAFALTSGDSNALLRVGDEPNARGNVKLVEPGMEVESQNVWPSLETDIMSLTKLGSRFMPVGFYYKTFMRPKSLWPVYEKVIRNAAGLGYVTTDIPEAYFDKKYEFADVLVIGGGPAGMSAALSAAEAGARVMLVDENPYLGGHLAYEHHSVICHNVAGQAATSEAAYALAKRLAQQVMDHPQIKVELNTNAFGIYEHLWIGAAQNDRRLLKIRAKSLVVANGAFELPLLFRNSDLPGVILGSAAQRLMHLYGAAPGKQAVVLAANRDGLQVALDLQAAGVQVITVVDLRDQPDSDLVTQLNAVGISVRSDSVVTKAQGLKEVNGVLISQVTKESPMKTGGIKVIPGTQEFVQCDLLVTSVGWIPATGLLYQARAQLAYNEERAEFLPLSLPPKVFAAGRVNGTHGVEAELQEGHVAGLNAAAEVGYGAGAPETLATEVSNLKAAEPVRTSPLVYVPKAEKSFISFDEDVSIKDVRDSVAEGYKSMELLKRYSTLSMGPSQGKYESLNSMAICAEANGQTINETGTTTSRPPFTAVPLGVLAGRVMEPVKYTPIHNWHIARGATMMNAGLWKRAEHYGNPTSEVLGTRNSLGLIDVSTLGKLHLYGQDVPKLLNMLYTNKWSKLAEGQVRYGVMCNEEGIIFDDGVTANLGQGKWYMTATSGGVNAVYENVEWNLQSGWDFDVHIVNMTASYAAMNLTGPNARHTLQALTDIDLSNDAFPYMAVRQGQVAGVPATMMRIGFTGELGYEMHVPAGYALYLWEMLMEAGQPYKITPFGVEAQRIMRLEKGHFIVGQDTDGLTDPFMAHIDWAVKMDKDDFMGKPSLLRIQKQGITHKLIGYEMLEANVVPEEANQIVIPNPEQPIGLEIIGRVTSCRYSPTLKKSIGLGWLPIDQTEPGTEFTVRIRGELHPGKVSAIPFYDPQGEKLKS